MKKLILILALTTICSYAGAQTWDWAKAEPNGVEVANPTKPDLANESDDAHDVATDADGNIYVLGDFADSLYLNNVFRESGAGSYLAKYDSTGTLIWYKTMIQTEPSVYGQHSIHSLRVTDMVVNGEGIFITGRYTPSTALGIDCSTTETSGEEYRTYRIGTFNFTSSLEDYGYFIAKIDNDGNVIWNKTGTLPNCLDENLASKPVVQYNPLITSDINNNIIASFVVISDRSSIFIGGNAISMAGNNDFAFGTFLITTKFNSNGVFQWSNYAGDVDNNFQDCNSMTTDNTGATYFYGSAMDGCSFGSKVFRMEDAPINAAYTTFLAKISSAGTWQYVKQLSNGSQNFLELGVANPTLLTVDNHNNVYALVNSMLVSLNNKINVAGIMFVGQTGLANTFIVKLDDSGDTKWAKNFGASYSGYANALHYAEDNIYMTGGLRYTYPDNHIFSKLTVPPSCPTGNLKYFVAKADTSGNFKWVSTFCATSNSTGFDISTFGNNIYTVGYYRVSVNSLGNLNGNFVNDGDGIYTHQIFFGKLKDEYIHIGEVTPTTLCTGNSLTIPFNSFGLTFSNANTFTAQLSDSTGNFDQVTDIGVTTSTGSGTITAALPDLPSGSSGYRVRIVSSELLKTGFPYYAYADTNYTITAGGQTFYQDIDADGYGNTSATSLSCSQPSGYVSIGGDCNDFNAAINPGATETCNAIDDNCDGQIDEGVVLATYYQDNDGDGYGNSAVSSQSCTQPTGYVPAGGDCSDNNAALNPGAAETCNGIDDNCDGQIDEGLILITYYQDNDGDGYGNSSVSSQSCAQPTGYVAAGGDCSDNNAAINPGSAETCNGIDDNCDSQVDEGVILATYYQDNDSDGYGNSAVSTQSCTQPVGYVAAGGDCSDNNAALNPGAAETCNGIDDNCDGQIDEGLTLTTYYQDNDGDGYGNSPVSIQSCSQPTGYIPTAGDCNDNNAAINPGAVEICGNGIDDNCNGQIDEGCTTTTPPVISVNDVTVYESQGTATLTVSLSKTSSQNLKLNFNTVDGTAVGKGKGKNPVIDYTALKGTVTIPAGSTTGTITISIINNLPTEPTEFFDVQLSLPKNTNATISDGSGRVTILDGAATLATIQSVNEIGSEAFTAKIYPNPGAEQFQLQVFTKSKEEITVRIVDMLGRQMKSWKAQPDQIGQFGMELMQGVYVAEIRQGLNLKTITFIKQ